MIRSSFAMAGFALLTACVGTVAQAQEPATTDAGTMTQEQADELFKARPYSPYAQRSFPIRPLFGDTHLHTAFSMDAGAFGARLGPRDAYKFARGEEVVSSTGQPVKLSRPLDFLVVTDHSDNMGFFPDLLAGKPELLADPLGRKWYDMIQNGQGAAAAMEIVVSFGAGKFKGPLLYSPDSSAYRGAWQQTIAAAEEANDPGRFTAVIGYEWTSNTGGNNLHRNVIYRDGAEKASQVVPFTTLPPGSDNPRDLWKWLQAYEDKTGGDVLAIAHNGNLSNGTMFPIIESFTGKEIDREYAEQRARWEVLYEATQMKGDGETHPLLSPNDEFANFERWDKANLDLTQPKKPEMLEFEYARSALKNGLKLEAKLGVNPYKFGLVGSTDAHTGLATADDDNFWGKVTSSEPSPGRATHPLFSNPKTGIQVMGWEETASGYAAVWAQENTRASIFDAMQRRETYATTGPRMLVRFFGGFDFQEADANSRSPAIAGYTKGVPMGGDIGPASDGQVADLPGRCAEGSDRRQSRPLPDHQGLARRGRRGSREGLRRGLVRRPSAGGRRQAAVGRQYGRRAERHMDEHDRGARADRGVEGPGLRSGAARLLLRPRHRDPDTALDGIRRKVLWPHLAAGSTDDDAGEGLYVADLVHSGGLGSRRACAEVTARETTQGI